MQGGAMSKSNKHWYPRYVGDYMSKTRSLSMLEHGAYTLLMDYYYSTNQPLDASASVLHRICSAFADTEQHAVASVLHQFFVLRDGKYYHERIDDELIKRSKISISRKGAAHRRWDKKQDAIAYTSTATATDKEPNNKLLGANKDKFRGMRILNYLGTLPNGSATQIPHIFLIESTAMNLEYANSQRLWVEFVDYWRSVAGERGVKLDWPATWRNSIRKTIEREGIYGNNAKSFGKSNRPSKSERAKEALRKSANDLGYGIDARPEGEGEANGDTPCLL
jgi:uncharacterized protein YdaU (DUF1376 family)